MSRQFSREGVRNLTAFLFLRVIADLEAGGPGLGRWVGGDYREVDRHLTVELVEEYFELADAIPEIVDNYGLSVSGLRLRAHVRSAIFRAVAGGGK